MDQRSKEEKLMKDLKDPDNSSDANRTISKMINDTLRAGHKVWLGTDWHLWLREEKNKPDCHKRSDFDSILYNFSQIPNEDLLIYMGDLVDGEFKNKDELKDCLIDKLSNVRKIMVLGNNDLFGKPFYKSCGFEHVVESFVWSDVLFTHIPCVNDNELNVCGHLHGYTTFWVPYKNQIEVGWCGGRKQPVELYKVINKQKSYSKHVKEFPEHFNESTYDNPFEYNMNNVIDDPYHDN